MILTHSFVIALAFASGTAAFAAEPLFDCRAAGGIVIAEKIPAQPGTPALLRLFMKSPDLVNTVMPDGSVSNGNVTLLVDYDSAYNPNGYAGHPAINFNRYSARARIFFHPGKIVETNLARAEISFSVWYRKGPNGEWIKNYNGHLWMGYKVNATSPTQPLYGKFETIDLENCKFPQRRSSRHAPRGCYLAASEVRIS